MKPRSLLSRLALGASCLLLSFPTVVMASSHLIYLGTYTRATSKGIYAIRLDGDTGALSEPILAAEATSPSWITLSPDKKFLYAVHGSKAQALAFSVDATQGTLTPLPGANTEAASASCHLVVDTTGQTLLAANYGDGYLTSVPIRADGTLGTPTSIQHSGKSVNPTRQEKPHVHSVTLAPDNRHVIVCDLGQDKIFTYALDAATAKLTPANPASVATDPGVGPRHFAFGANGRHGYAINEMGGSISVLDYNAANGALTPRQTVPTLPRDFTGLKWNAEVRVHPNGKFVYGSNRTHDSLAVFAVGPTTGLLTPVQMVLSGGKTPRNFALSPDGKWLVCGHQDSDELVVFSVNPETGRLTATPHAAKLSMVVCVLFYN